MAQEGHAHQHGLASLAREAVSTASNNERGGYVAMLMMGASCTGWCSYPAGFLACLLVSWLAQWLAGWAGLLSYVAVLLSPDTLPLCRAISCGAQHTVAVTPEDVITWGSNEYGQCGHGEKSEIAWVKPRSIKMLHEQMVTQVGAAGRLVGRLNSAPRGVAGLVAQRGGSAGPAAV